jgi:ribose-phosphate pyrophosphokinase
MKPLLMTLSSEGELFQNICNDLDVTRLSINIHEFPDGETYLKIDGDLKNTSCIIFETLSQPNTKLLPLLFLSETLRDLGAKQVGLIAPYLAYMRQDKRFHPGEAVTSKYFSKLISSYFDWMITVDPHLHRIKRLQEIYSIPTTTIHATKNISNWIKVHVNHPILIGPDRESQQWVEQISHSIEAPFLILEKIRCGDQQVEVSLPQIEKYRDYTPVLVDDIISTANTMIATIKHLKQMHTKSPICIGIHGLFIGNAYENLIKAGAHTIISCNTIPHSTNQIDLSSDIIEKLKAYF